MRADKLQGFDPLMETGCALVVSSGEAPVRSHDVHYPFRSQSHYQYLCQVNESQAHLLCKKTQQGWQTLLIKPDFCPKRALWEEPRSKLAELKSTFDHVANERRSLASMRGFLQDCHRLYISYKHPMLSSWKRSLKLTTADLDPLIGQLRLYKASDELEMMQKAIDLAIAGHETIMRYCQVPCNEAELAHAFLSPSAKKGITQLAYPSIVAGGCRACILHYTRNDQMIRDHDLVLVDAGIEYQGYSSDLTRTFPANGRFSAAQQALYEAVLDAQELAVSLLRPGVTWSTLNQQVRKRLLQHLLDIKMLRGSLHEHQDKGSIKRFFYHGVGHWLGLDVHDPCPYRKGEQEIAFAPGMALTLEPGLYIKSAADIDSRWHNIGIRIEDNFVISDNGSYNLSQNLAKSVKDIEALCQQSL